MLNATHTTERQIFTCKHELRNIWLDMQTSEKRKGTLGLVYFLLYATKLHVHPLVKENTFNHLHSHSAGASAISS